MKGKCLSSTATCNREGSGVDMKRRQKQMIIKVKTANAKNTWGKTTRVELKQDECHTQAFTVICFCFFVFLSQPDKPICCFCCWRYFVFQDSILAMFTVLTAKCISQLKCWYSATQTCMHHLCVIPKTNKNTSWRTALMQNQSASELSLELRSTLEVKHCPFTQANIPTTVGSFTLSP